MTQKPNPARRTGDLRCEAPRRCVGFTAWFRLRRVRCREVGQQAYGLLLPHGGPARARRQSSVRPCIARAIVTSSA
jgi:hypothetical protein